MLVGMLALDRAAGLRKVGREENFWASAGVVKIDMPRPEAKVSDVYTHSLSLMLGRTSVQMGGWLHGVRALFPG